MDKIYSLIINEKYGYNYADTSIFNYDNDLKTTRSKMLNDLFDLTKNLINQKGFVYFF